MPACRHGDDQDGARATASAVVARCDRIRAAHLVAGVDADPGVIPAAARVEGVRAGNRCIEYPKGVGGRVAIIVWQAGGTSGVCISAVKLASPGLRASAWYQVEGHQAGKEPSINEGGHNRCANRRGISEPGDHNSLFSANVASFVSLITLLSTPCVAISLIHILATVAPYTIRTPISPRPVETLR